MQRLSPLLPGVLALLFALITLAWWWPNRPQLQDVAMADARFNAVSFAPFRAGQSPLTDTFPSPAQAEADVALLAGHVRALRTYAANEGTYDVAALAQRHGLKLWQGIWLGADRASNAREIAKGIALARAWPDTIERVIVGNEVLLRRDLPPAELIAAIDQVRAAVRQPVTYADVWEFWEQFPEVAAHVDIVTIHLLPYWEDVPTGIDQAVAHVGGVYARMAARFPGKRIAIGETGWPSRGRWRADAAPGVVNEALFLRRFIALAHEKGFDYNVIEAFDQGWKYQNEGIIGANWGLWTQGRVPKFPLSGKVVENPHWRWDAAACCGLTVVLLAFGVWCCSHPSPNPLPQGEGAYIFPPPLEGGVGGGVGNRTVFPWVASRPYAGSGVAAPPSPGPSHKGRGEEHICLAILAAFLGTALGYAGADLAPDLYDVPVRIAGIANLAGQSLLALLLMRRAAAILAGETIPAPRTGADATRRMRALLRGQLGALRGWPDWGLDELSFVFVWTAGVLQLLLLFDSRYRDFPFAAFAVPLVAVLARAVLRDLPRGGGGRAEWVAGGVLASAAIASAVMEGWLNQQAMAWSCCALVLAAPALLRRAR